MKDRPWHAAEVGDTIVTLPRLAVDSPWGRLYKHPLTLEETVADQRAALNAGLLMPSVTNVIGVLDKPYLHGWYAKLAADAAVDVTFTHPGLIQKRPRDAKDWIKKAAPRYTDAAADLGTAVHDAVERLAREETFDIPDRLAGYVESWRQFVADFEPTFLHLEATCFGEVPAEETGAGSLKYAGTADFICRINGVTLMGDYKAGRAVHTEAALQASGLAHASEITLDDDSMAPMPAIGGGLVVHLTPERYFAYPAQIGGMSWDTFQRLRRVWQFHVDNLASRSPLFLGKALTGAAQVQEETSV